MAETANAMRNEKVAKVRENRYRTANISTSYMISMLLNPFPVTDLRPEVELMHLGYCSCADIIATKLTENGVALS